jgi:nonribosomal peptide synthetase VibF
MQQGLILNAQELNEFEQELAKLGVIQANQDKTFANPLTDNGQLSPSEERAWMLHQHDPLSAMGPFTAAFRLTGNIKPTQLITALKSLYQGDSNLNQIYKLDEQGELIKQHVNDADIDIEMLPCKTDQDVINFLLQHQNTPLDLSSQPTISFCLFHKSDTEIILGILGHHILIDDSAWKPIFKSISAFYKEENLAIISKLASSKATQYHHDGIEKYWLEHHSNGFNRTIFPAIFLRKEQASTAIHNINSSLMSNIPMQASRFYTTVSATTVEPLSKAAQASSFQTLLTLFGVYLSQLFNRKSVDVVVPIVAHQDITQLNQISSSSNVIPVTITNLNQDITLTIIEARNALLNGLSNNLPIEQIFSVTKTNRNSYPNILVTQVDDASDYLTLDDVKVENIAVPPLSSDYDLTLAIQFEKDGQTRFELTTGRNLSSTIGSFLLEKFIDFIEKAEAGSIPEFPSILTDDSSLISTLSDQSQNQSVPGNKQTDGRNKPIIALILNEFIAVLDQQDISEQDDFFELGGHSLLATRVIGKMKTQHNIEIKIADFFNAPTALALANFAEYADETLKEISTVDDNKEIVAPHSFVQLTYMPLIEQGRNPIFNIPFALKFSEPVDEQAFYQAFNDTIIRHHSLRTLLLIQEDEEPLQRVISASALKNYKWFLPSSEQGHLSAKEGLAHEANYHFDLINELPLRVRFLYNEQGEHFLSLLIYHTAFDEWSTGVLISDLFYAYKQYVTGQQPKWQTTPAQFHQYVLEQRQTLDMSKKLDYWLKYLGKVEPAKPLFYSKDTALVSSSEGACLEFSFDKSVADKLNRWAKANKSSMFHVVYAAFSLVMYYLGAGKKVLVATSAYGRDDPRYQDTVGLFTNVLLNHVQFAEELQFNQLITQVRDNIIALLPYSDVPYVTIEHAVAASPLTSPIDNLGEIYIQYHQKNVLNSAIELDDGKKIDFEMLEPERNIAKFGLHFEAYEDPNSELAAFRTVLAYRVNHYSTEQISLIKNTTKAVIMALSDRAEQTDLTLRDIRKSLAKVDFND